MTEARPRGPYAKTAARRSEIVRAARDSFAEHGYGKASLRSIAERAGITHAGLLHHFRNKDELLAAVLAERDNEEWEYVKSKVTSPQKVARYLGETLRHHQSSPELMRLWIELATAASRPGHPAHAYFVRRYKEGRRRFSDGMHTDADTGRLRADLKPEHAAVLLQAVLNGLQLQWLLDEDLDIVGPIRAFMSLIYEEPGDDGQAGSEAPAGE